MKVCSICKKNPAVVFVSRSDGTKMINEGYCLPCAIKQNITPVNQLADQFGIDPAEIENMVAGFGEFLENGDFNEAFEDLMGGGNLMMPVENRDDEKIPIKDAGIKKGIKDQQKKKKCLNNFGVNLTEKARQSLLDRVVGREKEIDRAIQILNRRSKNNPVLLGAPGVGKTAVAEGIAQRIADGNVPERLINAEVYLLDLSGVVAGTQYRGQFESRLKNIIEEARQDNTILVIDEIHSIVSAGDADGAMNAANILKPALAKGDIQVIGATTLDEYRKYIEKDAALERRFQPVLLDEPSVEETIEIVSGIRDYYEDFHNITIGDDIIREAVILSGKYINDRFFPDKAIDVIDEAASRINMDNEHSKNIIKINGELQVVTERLSQLEEEDTDEPQYEEIARLKGEKCRLEGERTGLRTRQKETVVTVADVAKVIELWTGIPAQNITETDKEKLLNLEERLHKRVVGQHKAVEAVSRAVRRNRTLKLSKKRPVSFIFAGPTGVGKTELVKALSEALFDDERSLIRLDMSEYMEKHSVAKITGSPPGYVGYDEGGQLTEKVRRKPYCVILLDEIEKAHADVFNILLQILDDGRITDSHGRTVNFENTIIIMTSNAGTSVGSSSAPGFLSDNGKISDRIHKSLKEIFRPEFLNRIDEIIEFTNLTRDELISICNLMLKDMVSELKAMGIAFDISREAMELLVDRGYTPRYGARPIRREIQTSVEDAVSSMLLSGELSAGCTLAVSARDGEIAVECKK